jgi:hypothetical protein
MYSAEIQLELDRAQKALEENNEGMVRVCARRAAGAAIRQWLAGQARPPAWGPTAVTRLRAIAVDESAPEAIRAAARRLSATVERDHTLPFDEHPLDDARLIVAHFAG